MFRDLCARFLIITTVTMRIITTAATTPVAIKAVLKVLPEEPSPPEIMESAVNDESKVLYFMLTKYIDIICKAVLWIDLVITATHFHVYIFI